MACVFFAQRGETDQVWPSLQMCTNACVYPANVANGPFNATLSQTSQFVDWLVRVSFFKGLNVPNR